MSNEVITEINAGIMTITINRPEAKNAINKSAAEEIAQAIDQLDSSDDVHVAILTGAGGTFCSGMDLKGFLKGEMPIIKGRGFAGITEKPPTKPLISAVEGYALAGGFELLLVSDLIVASNTAKFGIPEPKRGLVAGAGGLLRLPRQIPYRVAMELALTGDFFSAERAYELGMVNRLTEQGQALAGAQELAQSIVANGPLAVATTKQIIRESMDWNQDEMFKKQAPVIAPVFSSEDAKEGAAAFAQKRAPEWKGK